MKIYLYNPEGKGLNSFPLAEESPALFKEVFGNQMPNAKFIVLKYGNKLNTILFDESSVAHISARNEFELKISYEKYIEDNPNCEYDYNYYRNEIYTMFQPCGEKPTKALSKAKAAGLVLNKDGVHVTMDSDTFRETGLQDHPETEYESMQIVIKMQTAFKKAVRQMKKAS
jgi:hypothetical protein